MSRDQGATGGGAGALPPSRDVAIAARAAADKQATDIVVLDVSKIIVITDLFLICTASTQRQIRSVIDAVEEALRGLGVKPMRREGEAKPGWWLLDYIDVVVHVFGEEEREYHDLERLWATPQVSGGSLRTRRRPADRIHARGPIAQLVERLAGSQEVRGSTPLGPPNKSEAGSREVRDSTPLGPPIYLHCGPQVDEEQTW